MEEKQQTAIASGSNLLLKKKREEKNRKKDPRSWENVSKLIANISDTEKDAIIEKKYNELYDELRKTTINGQTIEKQYTILQKEKDHIQTEVAKSVLARSRLENLCRELQKQNKQIKEENIAKIKEEEERRKEVALKFAVKLSDINNIMDETKEKSGKLREENLKMTSKLAELYNEFQEREQDITKMTHQMDIERQYSQATLTKMELEIKAEREIWAKEHGLIQNNLEKSEANCRILQDTVKGLQDQIDVYKNQYADFESTMTKSNKVFGTFKFEMARMAKQVSALEKETQMWRNKCQNSAKTIIDLSEMKQIQDKAIQTGEKKIEQLQKLCRQLQVDRAAFLRLLKNHNITPTSQICMDENDKQCNNNVAKKQCPKKALTKKEKELELLRNEMKAFQDELNNVKYILPQQETEVPSENNSASEDNVNQIELTSTTNNSTDDQDAKTDAVQTELETNSIQKETEEENEETIIILEESRTDAIDDNQIIVDQ